MRLTRVRAAPASVDDAGKPDAVRVVHVDEPVSVVVDAVAAVLVY